MKPFTIIALAALAVVLPASAGELYLYKGPARICMGDMAFDLAEGEVVTSADRRADSLTLYVEGDGLKYSVARTYRRGPLWRGGGTELRRKDGSIYYRWRMRPADRIRYAYMMMRRQAAGNLKADWVRFDWYDSIDPFGDDPRLPAVERIRLEPVDPATCDHREPKERG